MSIMRFGAGILVLIAALAGGKSRAAEETNVGGLLAGRIEWTKAGSPYRLVQNVEVWEQAILKIEPGVVIRADGFAIFVSGTLVARGTEEDPIVFTSGRAAPSPGDWGPITIFDPGRMGAVEEPDQKVARSVLEHCVVEYGRGIVVNNGSPIIDRCEIRRNASKGDGGGILADGGEPRISNNRIFWNTAEHDGGGIRTLRNNLNIVGNVIAYNRAGQSGGGIACDYSSSTIHDNRILHNTAREGGGLATGKTTYGQTTSEGSSSSSPSISGNEICHNVAEGNGGGVHVRGGPTLTRNLIAANRSRALNRSGAPAGVGAGVFVHGTYGGRAEITKNQILANSGARLGGGAYLEQAGAEVANNVFFGNSASESGSALCLLVSTPNAGFGSRPHDGYVRIVGCLFWENSDGVLCFRGKGNQNVSIVNSNFERQAGLVLDVQTATGISAHRDWWGTEDRTEIAGRIRDFYDESWRGRALIDPAPRLAAATYGTTLGDEMLAQYGGKPESFAASLDEVSLFEDEGPVVNVEWQAPAGRSPAGYFVHYQMLEPQTLRPAGGPVDSRSPVDAGEKTSLAIKGLRPGMAYEFAVTARDGSGGEGPCSKPVRLTLPAAKAVVGRGSR